MLHERLGCPVIGTDQTFVEFGNAKCSLLVDCTVKSDLLISHIAMEYATWTIRWCCSVTMCQRACWNDRKRSVRVSASNDIHALVDQTRTNYAGVAKRATANSNVLDKNLLWYRLWLTKSTLASHRGLFRESPGQLVHIKGSMTDGHGRGRRQMKRGSHRTNVQHWRYAIRSSYRSAV